MKITWPLHFWIVRTSGILIRTCNDLKEATRTAELFTEDGALDVEIQVYQRLGKPKKHSASKPAPLAGATPKKKERKSK